MCVESAPTLLTRCAMSHDGAEPIAPKCGGHRFWELLESPLISRVVGESVFDFYAGVLSRGLTARKITARVEAVRDETPSVKSFVIRPNGHFRGFRAGRHVNVTVEIHGKRHTRCYSPSNAPDETGKLVLTVKREPRGLVSNWMHDRLRPGDWVELGQAFGDFSLSSNAPRKLLLIAGGSGVTPIASILRDLCARDAANDVVVLIYGRTRSDLIFAEDLTTLARRHRGLRLTFGVTRGDAATGDLTGRFSFLHIDHVAPDVRERQTFVCGPRMLIDGVRALWAERGMTAPLKTETFAPAEPMAADDGAAASSVQVNTTRALRPFAADTASSLLVQAERAGLSPKSGCRHGICFTCTCRKKTGVVRNIVTGAVSAEPNEDIRLCVSVPLSDLTLDL
jgi:ferredoxin-NADP reductase